MDHNLKPGQTWEAYWPDDAPAAHPPAPNTVDGTEPARIAVFAEIA